MVEVSQLFKQVGSNECQLNHLTLLKPTQLNSTQINSTLLNGLKYIRKLIFSLSSFKLITLFLFTFLLGNNNYSPFNLDFLSFLSVKLLIFFF